MLNIVIGPMKSSKSKYLIELYERLNKEETIVFTSTKTRSCKDKEYFVESRNEETKSIKVNGINNLLEIYDYLQDKNYKNILIDEFQFFLDIDVIRDLKKRYNVIIAGLVQSYKQEPFGLIGFLIHIADNIVYLKSICYKCNKDASNNIKKESNLDDIHSESISVCSNCLNNL